MSYTVRRYENTYKTTNKSNIVVNDNKINDVDSSLIMIGKHQNSYEKSIAENFLWLTENFYSATPPPNALIGQFWYRADPDPKIAGLYFWNGLEPNNLGDSTDASKWTPLSLSHSHDIDDHISKINPSNPHNVTKASILLGNVDNVILYDKRLSLGDIKNVVQARDNLSVYSKNETNTKTELNSLFYYQHDKVADSYLFGKYAPSDFVLATNPIIHHGIVQNLNTTKASFTVYDDRYAMYANTSTQTLSLNAGIDSNNKLTQDYTSGIIASLDNKNSNVKITLYDVGMKNTNGVYLNSMTMGAGTLTIDESRVYADGYVPTPAEIGAWGKYEKVNDTLKLNNMVDSKEDLPNTIAKRNGLDIKAHTYGLSLLPKADLNDDSLIMFKNIGKDSKDGELLFATKDDFLGKIYTQVKTSKAWASFDGKTGASINDSKNVFITKLGVGIYNIRIIYPPFFKPTSNVFPIILSATDDGGLTLPTLSWKYPGNEVLSTTKAWYSNLEVNNTIAGSTYLATDLTINTKRILNKQGVPPYYISENFDPSYVAFVASW